MKVWVVDILHICDRYSSWLAKKIQEVGDNMGVDIDVLGNGECVNTLTNYFTNEPESIKYELEQIRQLYQLAKEGDRVLWLDLDYPGFAVPTAFLLKKKGVKNYGIFHGAYFNEGDIWYDLPERKWFMKAACEVCEKVLVASDDFKNRIIINVDVEPHKIVVTGLPFYPENYEFSPEEKKDIIVTLGVDIKVPGYVTVEGRGHCHKHWVKLLRGAKYMVAFKKAETFGYAVLEALASGVIVLAPPKFNYREFKSAGDDLLIFVDSPAEARKWIETYVWRAGDVSERYVNTLKVISKYRDSARRIVEEVLK